MSVAASRFERGSNKGFPAGVLRARESSVIDRVSPLFWRLTVFQKRVRVASAPVRISVTERERKDTHTICCGGRSVTG